MVGKPESNVIRALKAITIASLVGPLLFLLYGAWSNFNAAERHAAERIDRGLDVLQEHALKALQGVDLTISLTQEILGQRSDAEIRAQENDLSARLAAAHVNVRFVQASWVFDRDGRPLLSSTVVPVPRELNNSDRDYFKAQSTDDVGTYFGQVIKARIGNFQFFVVSRRRSAAVAGSEFKGVIAVSVLPAEFTSFYARLAPAVADTFTLMRPDGTVLARFPATAEPGRLTPSSGLMGAIATTPSSGTLRSRSQLDDVEREYGYRRLPEYGLYVIVGVDRASVWTEVWDSTRGEVAFLIPSALAMFALAIQALRGTRREFEETARREQAESALKQAQRLEALGQLTGGVAHDFNNLLMVVSGNAERLRQNVPNERRNRALDAIETATKRGASLTRQLLSFSRRQTHEVVTVDLGVHLVELQEMLRPSLRGDIQLDLSHVAGLWPIRVDVGELDLAVLNIAVNARDAMPEGGRLSIAVQNVTISDAGKIGICGDFVAISLSDTGTGIPEESLGRVFEPFFTTKEIGKGTGLGLSQVYGFAVQSGGTTTVDSKLGEGTCVTLYLPRSFEAPEKPHLAGSAENSAGQQGRVLLVEDNSEVADVTRWRLEALGFHVTRADSPQVANLLLAEEPTPFHFVLSDIVMPGTVNGLDLARSVRARSGAALPVILATGYSNVARMAIEEGFTVLRKPYSSDDLKNAIFGALKDNPRRVVA